MIVDKLHAFGGALASPPASAARRPLRIALALLAYAAVGWLVYRSIDRASFSLGFDRLRPEHIALILFVAIAHVAVRALRFDRLMRSAGASSRYRLQDGVRLFLVGLSASAVTPGRAGDLIKARLVREFGIGMNRGLGLVLVERVLDLLAICTSLVLAGALLSGRAASDGWRVLAIGFLLSMLSGSFVLISPRVRDPLLESCALIASRVLPALPEERVLGHLREMLTVWDEVFRSPARFIGYFAVSLFAWSIEFGKLWLVLRCLGAPIDLLFAFFVYPASILAGLLSLLPISDAVVGVTGAVLLHTLAGVANGIATTAIVVDRTASVVPPLLLWGVFAFLRKRHDAS